MDTIIKAIPLDDYKVQIRTSSGIEGIFDVKPYLGGSAFKKLEQISYFNQLRPAHRGIMRSNEQDFSSGTIMWTIQKSEQERVEMMDGTEKRCSLSLRGVKN